MSSYGRRSFSVVFLTVTFAVAASAVAADQVPVTTWLRALAATQKFELVVGVGMGSVLVTPPAVATPVAIGEVLVTAGVPFGFTTTKDGGKILVLQLGIDALSKSVGIGGGAAAGSGVATNQRLDRGELAERSGRDKRDESEDETPKAVEDSNDPRLEHRPALPPQADPDDPIEALIDRSIPPLPKQFDLNDPEEAQIDPTRKPLPPQIDYNDPDEHRTPPVPITVPPPRPAPPPPAPLKTGLTL